MHKILAYNPDLFLGVCEETHKTIDYRVSR